MEIETVELADGKRVPLVLAATTYGLLEMYLTENFSAFEGMVMKSRDSNFQLTKEVETTLTNDHVLQDGRIHPAIVPIVLNCVVGDKLIDSKLISPLM